MIPTRLVLVISIVLLSQSFIQDQSFLVVKVGKIHEIVPANSKIERQLVVDNEDKIYGSLTKDYTKLINITGAK